MSLARTRSPWYRYWLLGRSMRGHDHLVDSILDGYVDAEVIAETREIYEDRLMKNYVEACLLATEDFDEISNTLEIDKLVLMIYHDIYYNVHDLPRIKKTKLLSKIEDSEERNLKQWAITNGIDFIKWRMGCLSNEKDPMDIMVDQLNDAFYKSKEAFFNGNTSAASKEGLQWSKQSLNIARLIASMEDEDVPEDAMEELTLELARITEENIDLPGIGDLK